MPVTRRLPILAIAFSLAFPAASIRAADPRRVVKPEHVLEQFEVSHDGDGLWLPVSFKGKTYRFLLDTRASFSTFDTALLVGEATLKRIDREMPFDLPSPTGE